MIVDRAIVYAEKEGFRALQLDVYRPDQPGDVPQPVLINVHGGGWRVSGRHRTPRETRSWDVGFYERLTEQHGFVVVACDYRFSGEALWPAAVDDVKDALRWVQANAPTYGADPERIALFGQSAGGYLAGAVGLAADVAGVRGVACWYPITDFTALDQHDPASYPALFLGGALGTVADRAAAASLPQQVHAGAPPFFLAHGTADTMAPYDQSVRLDRALGGIEHVRLEAVEGGEHFFGGREDAVEAVWASTVEFLRKVTQ